MSDFSCPHCGSKNTRSYKAIAEDGTSVGTLEVSVSDIRGRPSSGTSDVELITDAARAAAKPKPAYSAFKAVARWCFTMGGTFLAVAVASHFLSNGGYGAFGFGGVGLLTAVIGVISYAIGAGIDADKDADIENRIAQWSKMWRCSRCGESFEVSR